MTEIELLQIYRENLDIKTKLLIAMSKETKDLFGGLKIRNNNEINITLFCELCRLLQLHPIQLLCCGTRLCRWCSKKGLSDR